MLRKWLNGHLSSNNEERLSKASNFSEICHMTVLSCSIVKMILLYVIDNIGKVCVLGATTYFQNQMALRRSHIALALLKDFYYWNMNNKTFWGLIWMFVCKGFVYSGVLKKPFGNIAIFVPTVCIRFCSIRSPLLLTGRIV